MNVILSQFAGVIQVNGNPEHSFDLPLPTYSPVPEARDPESEPAVIDAPVPETNLLGAATGSGAAATSDNTATGGESNAPAVDPAAEAEAARVAQEAADAETARLAQEAADAETARLAQEAADAEAAKTTTTTTKTK